VLKKCFDTFDREKKGYISSEMVGNILSMMGLQFSHKELRGIITEIDVDGSGQIEFNEFVLLASKFMSEEDSGVMEQELREAFRLYDKEGQFMS
jgi:Ca2+-binding EF-hand superfamily protein